MLGNVQAHNLKSGIKLVLNEPIYVVLFVYVYGGKKMLQSFKVSKKLLEKNHPKEE